MGVLSRILCDLPLTTNKEGPWISCEPSAKRSSHKFIFVLLQSAWRLFCALALWGLRHSFIVLLKYCLIRSEPCKAVPIPAMISMLSRNGRSGWSAWHCPKSGRIWAQSSTQMIEGAPRSTSCIIPHPKQNATFSPHWSETPDDNARITSLKSADGWQCISPPSSSLLRPIRWASLIFPQILLILSSSYSCSSSSSLIPFPRSHLPLPPPSPSSLQEKSAGSFWSFALHHTC